MVNSCLHRLTAVQGLKRGTGQDVESDGDCGPSGGRCTWGCDP